MARSFNESQYEIVRRPARLIPTDQDPEAKEAGVVDFDAGHRAAREADSIQSAVRPRYSQPFEAFTRRCTRGDDRSESDGTIPNWT